MTNKDNSKIKFSIITINLNNKAGLFRTIESVVSQTYTDFEYIVIDGASTDGSKEIIQQYADQIDYWVSEPDNGIYQAMNKGIKDAKGDFLLFLNSGDILNNNKILENVNNKIVIDDEICIGDMFYKTKNGLKLIQSPDKVNVDYVIFSTLSHQATFIRRDLFDKYGFYLENYKIISDWIFFCETLILNNVGYKKIDEVISIFDLNGISRNPEFHKLHQEEKETYLKKKFSPRMYDYIFEIHTYSNIISGKRFKMLIQIEKTKLYRYFLHFMMKILVSISWKK